jgi:hypothetical protein
MGARRQRVTGRGSRVAPFNRLRIFAGKGSLASASLPNDLSNLK